MSFFTRFAGKAKEIKQTQAKTDREQFIGLIDEVVSKPDLLEKNEAKLKRLMALAEQFGIDTGETVATAGAVVRTDQSGYPYPDNTPHVSRNLWEGIDAIAEYNQLKAEAESFPQVEAAREQARKDAEDHAKETDRQIEELKRVRGLEHDKLSAAYQATFDGWYSARAAVDRRDAIRSEVPYYFGEAVSVKHHGNQVEVPPMAVAKPTDTPELREARKQYLQAALYLREANANPATLASFREQKIAAFATITRLEQEQEQKRNVKQPAAQTETASATFGVTR